MEKYLFIIYTIFYQTLSGGSYEKSVLILLLFSVICVACSAEKTEPQSKPQEAAVATQEPIYEKKEIEYMNSPKYLDL